MSVSLRPGEPFNPYRMFTGIFVPSGIGACRQLHQGAKLAYGALLRFAGRDGTCFPSMQALGAKLGVSSRQARAYIAALEEEKLHKASETLRRSRAKKQRVSILMASAAG